MIPWCADSSILALWGRPPAMCCFLISSALRVGCCIPADMSGFWSWQSVCYMTEAVHPTSTARHSES